MKNLKNSNKQNANNQPSKKQADQPIEQSTEISTPKKEAKKAKIYGIYDGYDKEGDQIIFIENYQETGRAKITDLLIAMIDFKTFLFILKISNLRTIFAEILAGLLPFDLLKIAERQIELNRDKTLLEKRSFFEIMTSKESLNIPEFTLSKGINDFKTIENAKAGDWILIKQASNMTWKPAILWDNTLTGTLFTFDSTFNTITIEATFTDTEIKESNLSELKKHFDFENILKPLQSFYDKQSEIRAENLEKISLRIEKRAEQQAKELQKKEEQTLNFNAKLEKIKGAKDLKTLSDLYALALKNSIGGRIRKDQLIALKNEKNALQAKFEAKAKEAKKIAEKTANKAETNKPLISKLKAKKETAAKQPEKQKA